MGVYTSRMQRDTKVRALHRVKIIKGQIEGLEKRISDDAYCMDIVTQSLAIQKSLASLSKLMVEHHIEVHIQHMFSSGDDEQVQKAMTELSQLYELSAVRGK